MYDDVLVPTDGSDGVLRAIQEGVDLAELSDATVHGLYVVDDSTLPDLPDAELESLLGQMESEGEEAVAQVTGEADRKGLDTEREIVRGEPHEAILDYAEVHDVDAVVMGTHGRSGVNRFLLGSVTERVIRRSTIPVLVVRIGEDVDVDE